MCQPRKWWWGLAPLAMLWMAASALVTPVIESDITHRAGLRVTPAGQQATVKLAIEGRDVIIEGVAPPKDRLRAMVQSALDVNGVRLVVNNAELDPETANFRWSASREGKALNLSGQVAAGPARGEILATAKKAMPGLTVNDQMIEAPVPAERQALPAIALAQLAKLRSGSVSLLNNEFSINGTTADETSAVALTVAVSQLPGSLKTASVDVRGPVSVSRAGITPVPIAPVQASLPVIAGPYIWSAAKGGGSIRLAGSVPSESARAQVIAAARAVAGKARVADKMRLAATAEGGAGFEAAPVFAVGLLAHLKAGSVKLADAKLTIEGEAADAAGFHSLTNAVNAALPSGLILDQIAVVPPRAANYKWSANRTAKTLTLTGNYPDEATHQAMLMAAAQRFAGLALVDRTVIASGAPPGFAPAVGMGLDQLAQLVTGEASIAASRLTLSGVAASANVVAQAKIALTKLVGGMPAEARVTVAAAVALPAPPAAPPTPAAVPTTPSPAPAASPVRAVPPVTSPVVASAVPPAPASSSAPAQVAAASAAAAVAACATGLTAAANAGRIQFASSKADVLPPSMKVIKQVADVMRRCPAMVLEIAGHTDKTGAPGSNDRLSKSRAVAIAALLVKRGIETKRVRTVGYGAARPVADNVTPAGKARNRRIEFNAT